MGGGTRISAVNHRHFISTPKPRQSSPRPILGVVPPRRSSPDRKGVDQNQPRSSSANAFRKQVVRRHDGEGEGGYKSHTKIRRAHSIEIPPPDRWRGHKKRTKCDGARQQTHREREREKGRRSEAHSVHDLRPSFVVLVFGDPHFLKRAQRRQDGAPDPD